MALNVNELDQLRDDLIANEASDSERVENNNSGKDNNNSAIPQQEDQQKQEKELPPVPVDFYFLEACKKAGVDPTTAWNKSNENTTTNTTKNASPPKGAPPLSSSGVSNPRNKRLNAPTAAASASAAAAKTTTATQQHRPSSSTSNRSSSRASSVDSVAAVAQQHRIVCAQERKLRDLLTVLTERKNAMQERSKSIARNLRFKQRLKQKARILRANRALQAAWEHELQERAAIRQRATSKNSSTNGSSTNNNHNNNNGSPDPDIESPNNNHNIKLSSIYSAHRDMPGLAELGRDGEDALFEQALRQRQVWDLRTMRQQRARDRREAEYQVRLRRAEDVAAEEWRRHDRSADEAKMICKANHIRVKERRARDEAHIANVEARFAMIDEHRAQQYREHLADIKTARQRRDGVMRSVVDQRMQHDKHMAEVNESHSRQQVEKAALIQQHLEQLEQQRTRHEFLRFVRDVELANRSLAERDHTLIVVHRSEEKLEKKREKIMQGFAKTEEAVARVERELTERAREHAEQREQRHYEARALRISNDEQAALRRLEKMRREQAARERKARDDEKRNTLAATRFEQQRVEQEDRVERLSKKMMARREAVVQNAEQRFKTVEQRQAALNVIRTVQSSPLVEV